MEVKAHNTWFSCELKLWEGRILNSVATDQASVLLQEIIWTITYSKQITVSWIPANRSNVLLSTSLCWETPKRKNWTYLCSRLFNWIFIILVIFELLFVSILNYHSLHDLKSSFHRNWIKRILNSLHNLLDRSLIFLILHLFLDFSSLDLFIGCHIGVEDLPLSCFEWEVRLDGRICLHTLLFER